MTAMGATSAVSRRLHGRQLSAESSRRSDLRRNCGSRPQRSIEHNSHGGPLGYTLTAQSAGGSEMAEHKESLACADEVVK
jgi:hypothetical protein